MTAHIEILEPKLVISLGEKEKFYNTIYVDSKQIYLIGNAEGLGAWLFEDEKVSFINLVKSEGDNLDRFISQYGVKLSPGVTIFGVINKQRVLITTS